MPRRCRRSGLACRSARRTAPTRAAGISRYRAAGAAATSASAGARGGRAADPARAPRATRNTCARARDRDTAGAASSWQPRVQQVAHAAVAKQEVRALLLGLLAPQPIGRRAQDAEHTLV